VKIRATIEVNFRFPGILFDDAAETNRTKYNTALRDLKLEDRKGKALETFRSLAAKKYPPAMALLGEWKTKGQEGPKDVPGGIEMIRKAADRYDSGALFWLGKLYVDGEGVAADPDRGLKLIREASMYGSPGAQFYLGMKYGPQAGAVAEPERSRQYFRLCAARGTSLCQFYLGKMLMPAAGYKGDAVQALAWLELADGSVHEAGDLAKSVRDTLTAEEIARAEKLKRQLVRD
jgi:TPR repeat protein